MGTILKRHKGRFENATGRAVGWLVALILSQHVVQGLRELEISGNRSEHGHGAV